MISKLQPAKGFSLVELLISMAIGLVILTGVVTVMVDSKNSYVFEEQTSYIQENARFLVDQIGFDLRMAGYLGCPRGVADIKNSLPNASTNPAFGNTAVRGHTAGQTSYPGGVALPINYDDIKPDTDILVINYGLTIDGVSSDTHINAASLISFNTDPNIPSANIGDSGDVVVVSGADCRKIGIFQQQVAGLTVTYSPADLFDGNTLKANSTLSRLVSHGYYVKSASPTTNLPALYKVTLSGGGVVRSEELMSGVDDMRVLYGVTDASGNTQFMDSTNVGTVEADWNDVSSVRLSFVLRSSAEVFNENTPVDLGEGFNYNDRFMRQLITLSSNLRN